MASSKKPLTEDMIDDLPDDDPGEAVDLLEDYGIDAEGVETTADAQQKLRDYLKQNKEKDDRFKCKECDLTSDDIEIDLDLEKARKLLAEHHITTGMSGSLKESKELLLQHLVKKQELEEENLLPIYSLDKVATVVQDLVEKTRYGRQKLLSHCHSIQTYLESIPADRTADIQRQLPTVTADLEAVDRELMRDDCTIMVAGETGSGKSCLLNLLLGELSAELMSVNNLPSTSSLTEIKHGDTPCLKAHSAEADVPVEHVMLDRETAPATIQRYTHQMGDRSHFKYNRVEVFWPCDWIKNGITITDTPGVGENEELTNMVKDYLPKAYGFIYVINTPNAGGINPEELEDLLFYHITREGLEGGGGDLTTGEHASKVKFDPRSAIFVCNKWDQVAANERDEIKKHVKVKLKKVWRDFDFEHQVFFLSAKKTIEEVKSGYVSKEFRRLLLGIQNLLPVGFKTKLEKQFWTMFHVIDRCTWVLKSFIMSEDQEEETKQKKRDQYHEARTRLAGLQKRPEEARKEMREILSDEVNFALSQIKFHMQSREAEERLLVWQETECPDNDNLDRLHKLQNALAQRRIKKEINKFEQDNGIFEGIQKKLVGRFHKIFVSVESELASIEQTMKEEAERGIVYSSLGPGRQPESDSNNIPTAAKIAAGVTSPIWVPLAVVAGAFALPFAGIKALQKRQAAKKQLQAYRQNKPREMQTVTKSVLSAFLDGDRLRTVLEDKLGMLRKKFNHLLDRIPNIIEANQRLVSELERELDQGHDFQQYIPIYNNGLRIQDTINYTYMVHIRTYSISMGDVRDMKKIGEGAFAVVYKGKYTAPGRRYPHYVAVKRQKDPLTEEMATEFMTEELNLLRIQSPNIVKYLGASYKRNLDVMYPVMIQEYCATSLSNIIYSRKNYQGPGSLPESDQKRKALVFRAARYCDEISRGLMAMHNMGLVHRDMKPENILVDTLGNKDRIKLCDLGISKREADIMMTLAGTPMYMAPEVLKEKQYNRSVDIFSLGLIVWEIWYGNPIEKVYTEKDKAQAELNPRPPTAPSAPPEKIDNYDTFRKTAFRDHKPTEEWRLLMRRCWSPKSKDRPSAYECSQLFCKYYNSAMETGTTNC